MKRTVLLLLAIPLAACGSSTPSGYLDPATLAARLRDTAQARMDKNPSVYAQAKVTETKCVADHGRVFKCSGEISSGARWTITVTVSDDGRTYVSDQS